VMRKKFAFKQWVAFISHSKCRENLMSKVHNYTQLKIHNYKALVFHEFRLCTLKSKMLKDRREQENLRALLKSDLEEKFRLKEKIQNLTLESKDKSMQMSELEASALMKTQTMSLIEQKYTNEHKMVLPLPSKLAQICLKLTNFF
jgi:cell shape-determining protein MreC